MVRRAVILAILAACGGAGSSNGDIDAAREPDPDAISPTIRVRLSSDACAPSVTYHVTKPDGTLATTTQGAAPWNDIEVEPGDMLTAVTTTEVYSVAGVEPGDDIEVGTPCTRNESAYVLVSWDPYPGAQAYVASSECQSITPVTSPTYLPYDARCAGPTATFVVSALDSAFDVIAWAAAEDQRVVDQSAVHVSGWLEPHPVTISVAAQPDDVVQTGLWWTLGSIAVPMHQVNRLGSVEETRHVPATGRALVHATVDGQSVSEWLTPSDSEFSFDGTTDLPELDAANHQQGSGTIAWYPDPGTAFDATIVRLRRNPNYDEWTIVLPPGTTSVTLPAIPGVTVQDLTRVAIFDRADVTSYSQVRGLPHAQLARPEFGGAGILPAPDGGTIEWSSQEATLVP